MFLQILGIYLQVHTALHHRRPTLTSSPLLEPKISHVQILIGETRQSVETPVCFVNETKQNCRDYFWLLYWVTKINKLCFFFS
jgi:hypothetical protein